MYKELREYIDNLFMDAPQTKKTVEVKEEILQNLSDKYNDLVSEGKSEDAAFNISVASVGDIGELIEDLKGGMRTENDIRNYEEEKIRNAILTSAAVALYILTPIPILTLRNTNGLIIMFLMIAAATSVLIFKHMTGSVFSKNDETMVEEFMEWRDHSSSKNQVLKDISSALWALTIVVYFLVSIWTHAWHITWVIFLISTAISNILKAIFNLRR